MSINLAAITPVPTEEEAAAIAAAVTMMWPQPVSAGNEPTRQTHTSWRFSGRWWANDAISRRGRPGS